MRALRAVACSSWRKTTTSLRIALEYARKNSRNQKRILPTVSRSRVPDRGSCRSRASGAIAQQKPRQLGDVGGDPAARLVLSRRLLTARSSDPASEIETVKNCRPWYSPHRGDAGLRRAALCDMPNDEWHDRAAELRALAERMSNINTKRTMLRAGPGNLHRTISGVSA